MSSRSVRVAGWGQAMLAGAMFATFVGRMQPESGRRAVIFLVLAGALYGLGVLGLIRLFRTRSFGYLAAGLLCGPFPVAVLVDGNGTEGDRAGMFVVCALLGLLIGALEWARSGGASSGAPAEGHETGGPPR